MSNLKEAKGMLIFPGPLFACQTRVVLKNSCLQLTVEKAQLQKRCQGCKNHEKQESSSPPQKPDHWAHGQAGCQGNPSHGVVVRVEVVGNRHLRFVPHHAFCKTVVYAVTSQPRGNRRGQEEIVAEKAATCCNLIPCRNMLVQEEFLPLQEYTTYCKKTPLRLLSAAVKISSDQKKQKKNLYSTRHLLSTGFIHTFGACGTIGV